MEVLRLKSCPKCKTGAVGVDRDQYGWYEYCIQCGYMRDSKSIVGLGQQQYYGVNEKGRKLGTLSKGK